MFSAPWTKIRASLAVATTVTGVGALTFALVGNASGAMPTVADAVQADGSAVSQVKSVFSAAIQADITVQAPDAGSAFGQRAASAMAAGQIAPAPDAATRQLHLQSGLTTLARYFTPAEAQHEAIGLRNAVAAEADPGFRNIGFGVSNITVTQVAVAGSTASVQAQVTEWAKFQQIQPDGTWATDNPVNVMQYSATLAQDATGRWLVTSLVGDAVPGKGP
jgi:hypothetical protein